MFQVLSFEPRTLVWWYHKRDDIDFSPSYQRRSGRWSAEDQSYLINSIINYFDIPKFYITDFTFLNTKLNTAGKAYAVIDGKQRLEAIFSFLEGRLRLNKNFYYYKDPSINLSGMSYYDLKSKYPSIASDIDNYSLTIMRVITDDKGLINELFLRLNRSRQLTGAEVRNAMGGVIVDNIRSISRHLFFVNKISFSNKKSEDLNLAAKIMLIESRGGFVDIKRINLDKFVKDSLKSELGDFASTVDTVFDNLAKMCAIFRDRDPLLRSQGDIPVYYWLIRNYSSFDVDIRHFLVSFNKVRENPSYSNDVADESIADFYKDITRYNYMRRSTNDQVSLRGRYSILEKYLKNGIPAINLEK